MACPNFYVEVEFEAHMKYDKLAQYASHLNLTAFSV
jgi:hypothetical protein